MGSPSPAGPAAAPARRERLHQRGWPGDNRIRGAGARRIRFDRPRLADAAQGDLRPRPSRAGTHGRANAGRDDPRPAAVCQLGREPRSRRLPTTSYPPWRRGDARLGSPIGSRTARAVTLRSATRILSPTLRQSCAECARRFSSRIGPTCSIAPHARVGGGSREIRPSPAAPTSSPSAVGRHTAELPPADSCFIQLRAGREMTRWRYRTATIRLTDRDRGRVAVLLAQEAVWRAVRPFS